MNTIQQLNTPAEGFAYLETCATTGVHIPIALHFDEYKVHLQRIPCTYLSFGRYDMLFQIGEHVISDGVRLVPVCIPSNGTGRIYKFIPAEFVILPE